MTAAPLILSPELMEALHALRVAAARRPIDMRAAMAALENPGGGPARRHRAHMQAQTVRIPGPWPFFVTFSIEAGHPAGTCRHMSMSVLRDGRVPSPAAVLSVAKLLGFCGGWEACKTWAEQLSDGGVAINVVQPIAMQDVGGPPPLTCPRCGARSFNPHDAREGYCGRCHDWTDA